MDFLRDYAVIILLVLFAGVLFWAFRPKNRRRFEDDARIPFRDQKRRKDDRDGG